MSKKKQSIKALIDYIILQERLRKLYQRSNLWKKPKVVEYKN